MNDHMKEVAKRCTDRYFKNKDDFNSYMLWLGWTQEEIDQMIKYIERYCKNEKNLAKKALKEHESNDR